MHAHLRTHAHMHARTRARRHAHTQIHALSSCPSLPLHSGCTSHYLFSAIAGSILQYQGMQQGFLFDPPP